MTIGVFDSGVGGLSVWREIARLMPDEHLVYLADQANVPYGPRPLDDIRALTAAGARWLIERGSGCVVIACNTASAAALGQLRSTFPGCTFVGMEPAVKPAARTTRTGVIGVVATEATLKAERFASLVERFAGGLRVIEQPCPEWVGWVERGEFHAWAGSAELTPLGARLWPLLDNGADTIVLGCTHFVFLKDALRITIDAWKRAHGSARDIELIDPSPAVAQQTLRVCGRLAPAPAAAPMHEFFTTGDGARFEAQVRTLLHFDASQWTRKTSVASTRF